VKLQEAVLLLASVAVQVTGVVPLAKLLPLAGTQENVALGQLSAMTGVKVTLLVHVPSEVFTTMSDGQMIEGNS
jgi:hypothetical protein